MGILKGIFIGISMGIVMGILMAILMGIWKGVLMGISMMVSMGWPLDSSDCLLYFQTECLIVVLDKIFVILIECQTMLDVPAPVTRAIISSKNCTKSIVR